MRSIKQSVWKFVLLILFVLTIITSTGDTAQALDVKQQNLVISDQSPTVIIHDAGINEFKIAPNLEFNRLNDFVTYKLTLRNQDGKKYQITGINNDNSNNAIGLSYTYPTYMDATDKDIQITIKYVQPATTSITPITINIELIDEEYASQNINFLVPNTHFDVPNTGALTVTDRYSIAAKNILSYTIFAVIIVAMYIIVRHIKRKKHKSTKSTTIIAIAALLLGLVPVTVIATISISLDFLIDFSNVQFNGPYTVTFDTTGGSSVAPQTVEHNDLATKPQNPTKEHYDFVKWLDGTAEYDFSTPITGDKTLTAQWERKKYTVSYDTNGGNAVTPSTFEIESGEPIGTLATTTKDHYNFDGWYINNTKIDSAYVVTSNLTLKARYTPKNYTITYHPDKNSPTTTTASYNIETATFSLPTLTKENHRFMGWYEDQRFKTPQVQSINQGTTGDKEYFAKWNEITTETYKEPALGDSTPVFKNELVPVILSSDGTVRKADITNEWYNYENKEWANAVLLKNNSNYSNGQIISNSNIKGYFVWIPKYKYKIFNLETSNTDRAAIQEIEISFDTTDTTDTPTSCKTPMKSSESGTCAVGKWMTHPAFISMNTNGLWVAKFESDATPNKASFLGTNVKTTFENRYNYARTHDSHMIKNTEWGAVAYLSHSKYGKNSKVYSNNGNQSGCGADNLNDTRIDTCLNGFGTKLNNVYNQSTTGNVDGIFDMAGGQEEQVAGYMEGYYGLSQFDDTSIAQYDKKYFDLYQFSANQTTYHLRILGDATGELGPISAISNTWYGQYAYFIVWTSSSTFQNPWFRRGGANFAGQYANIFSFNNHGGAWSSSTSSRTVLVD